jgi:hypothetical protein
MTPKMTPKTQHLLIALVIFILEILIATTFAKIGFVRSYLGDYLVVMFLYHLIQSIRPFSPWPLAMGVFVFACAIETAQFFHIVDVLGLQRGNLLRMLIGTHFSWMDLMYGLGSMTSYLIDTRSMLKRAA